MLYVGEYMKKQAAAIHYEVIKNNNKKVIRNQIRISGSISKAEIVELCGLSFPTVSQAVGELLASKELIESVGKSSGGRPGNVYSINPEFEYFACGIFEEKILRVRIYDYCGCEKQEYTEPNSAEYDGDMLVSVFEKIKTTYPLLRQVVLGIPGICVNGQILHCPHCKKLEGLHLVDIFKERLSLCVYMENDINAIALGECKKWNSFAHIIWIQGCIGSAVVIDGKLIRGAHGCAGEIEYVCHDLTSRIECLKDAMMAMFAVVDVPVIAFSGKEITSQDMEILKETLEQKVRKEFRPDIVYVENENELYFNGLWQRINAMLMER